MTNRIGYGTRNLSLNLPADERLELGKAAFRANAKSVGDFVKRCLLKGLTVQDPAAATRIRGIRRQYYGVACGVICLSAFLAGLLAGTNHDLRRAGRRVRSERIEEVREA